MISEKELEAEFFQLSTAAEEAHVVERAEAIKIQACWRGCLTRDRVNACRYAAVVIQRVFRGHLGRKRFGEYHREKAKVERAVYFNAAATGIQRYWRGFLTRKFTCDFYSRKAWIQQVLKVSEELKKEMEEMHQQQLEEVEVRVACTYAIFSVGIVRAWVSDGRSVLKERRVGYIQKGFNERFHRNLRWCCITAGTTEVVRPPS
jgi:hypothetical protein